MFMKRENSHIVIVKRLPDQFGHAAGEFGHTDGIGDLGTDLPHQIQLIDPESFHRHAMRRAQADGDHPRQSLEQVQFVSKQQLLYLDTFLAPDLPDDAEYPKRALWIGGVFAATLLIWGAVVGALTNVRSRLV